MIRMVSPHALRQTVRHHGSSLDGQRLLLRGRDTERREPVRGHVHQLQSDLSDRDALRLHRSISDRKESPPCVVTPYCCCSDKFGRRWMHVLCMVLATLPLLLSIFVVNSPNLAGLLVGLTIASKTASNVGWFIMWVQAIEIFPTPLRNTGDF